MPDAFRLELDAPAYLVIVADGREFQIDPFEADRAIWRITQATPEPAEHWPLIRATLGEYLGVPAGAIAENQARQFCEAVGQLVKTLDEQLKKTSVTTVSLPPAIPVSPTTSEAGQPIVSEHGWGTLVS